MYYGGWGHCNVVQLNDDFTGLVPFEDGTVYKEVTPENYVEGPFMFKKDGKYYFMWSEGGWGGPDYSVAYAISDSPFGPFKRVAKILQQDPSVATSAGHHSLLHAPGTDDYYIVYHRRPLNDNARDHRVTCIDKMTFDKDGFINPVKMTFEGVPAQKIKKSKKKQDQCFEDVQKQKVAQTKLILQTGYRYWIFQVTDSDSERLYLQPVWLSGIDIVNGGVFFDIFALIYLLRYVFVNDARNFCDNLTVFSVICFGIFHEDGYTCLLYTSPSPRDTR